MSTRLAVLLRGINVGGNKRVPMAELRTLLAGVGCTDVVTLLNSGNAVVSSPIADQAALASLVEAAIVERFGFDVAVVTRDADQLRAVAHANPLAHADRDPSRLLVTFLAETPRGRSAFDALDPAEWAPHEFHLGLQELYAWYPQGAADAPRSLPQWESLLGTVGTARNWRTTLRLAELLGQRSESFRSAGSSS